MKKTYEFKGSNTSRTARYSASGNSFSEVMFELIEKNVISNESVDNYVMKLAGTTNEDYIDEDGDFNQEKFDADYSKAFNTDADYYKCITWCDGNAYNQEWEIYDDLGEYEVDSNGELHEVEE